jgi:hypothetical protein
MLLEPIAMIGLISDQPPALTRQRREDDREAYHGNIRSNRLINRNNSNGAS